MKNKKTTQIVTRIEKIPVQTSSSRRAACPDGCLTRGKYNRLAEMARELGKVSAWVWRVYGSVKGVKTKKYDIIKDAKLQAAFTHIPKKLIQVTVAGALHNITMTREAAKVKVRSNISNHPTFTDEQKKERYTKLKSDNWDFQGRWFEDSYLRRKMRKHWKKGATCKDDQIVLGQGGYNLNKPNFISVQSFINRKQIRIPFKGYIPKHKSSKSDNYVHPEIRIMIKQGFIEIHYPMSPHIADRQLGAEMLGLDKGMRDFFLIDNEGREYGGGAGARRDAFIAQRTEKGKRRNKLHSIAEKAREAGDLKKARNIEKYNLGKKKWSKREQKYFDCQRNTIIQAVHKVFDNAHTVVAENLTFSSTKDMGKKQNRRVSQWEKGVLRDVLEEVGNRRGASVHIVNAAYTSQMDSRDGTLRGSRSGESFICHDRVVMCADTNGAVNILHRFSDPDISLYTPKEQVKAILEKRTQAAIEHETSEKLSRLTGDSGAPKTLSFQTAIQLELNFDS